MLRLVSFILIITSLSLAADFTQVIEKTIDARDLKSVKIFTTNGNIVVKTSKSNQIHLIATKKVKGSEAKKERLLKSIKIEINEVNGVLEIKVTHKKNDRNLFGWLFDLGMSNYAVDFDLEIPRQMGLTAHSTNGDIEVSDLAGTLQIVTTNGEIKAFNVQKVNEIHSTNGEVNVEFNQLPETGEVEISTTNGEIAIVLPEKNPCNIKAFTTNGRIDCQIPVGSTMSKSDNHLEIIQDKNLVTLFLKTTNGDIKIYSQ